MARSEATKAKIAAGMRAYHKSCKGGKKKAPKKAGRSVFAPGRLVDNRGRGKASRRNKDGSVDKRFKPPPRPSRSGRSAKLIAAAKKRGQAPLPPGARLVLTGLSKYL